MQKISNHKLQSIASVLLILLLMAKLISLALWWYLPSDGVELNAKKSYQMKYQRVDFFNMLTFSKAPEFSAKKESNMSSVDDLLLKVFMEIRCMDLQ